MRRATLLAGLVAGAAVLAACGYTPAAPGSSSGAGAGSGTAYAADYDACDAAVPAAVNRRNAKTGAAWFGSVVTRWSEIDNGMSACMADKGWGRTRECTTAERRTGGGNPVVTRAGVECRDPAQRG